MDPRGYTVGPVMHGTVGFPGFDHVEGSEPAACEMCQFALTQQPDPDPLTSPDYDAIWDDAYALGRADASRPGTRFALAALLAGAFLAGFVARMVMA